MSQATIIVETSWRVLIAKVTASSLLFDHFIDRIYIWSKLFDKTTLSTPKLILAWQLVDGNVSDKTRQKFDKFFKTCQIILSNCQCLGILESLSLASVTAISPQFDHLLDRVCVCSELILAVKLARVIMFQIRLDNFMLSFDKIVRFRH